MSRDELLKRFDANRNGRLDATEREQAFTAMRKKKAE